MVSGTWNQAKLYRGRDWRTEVIKVVLPAWESNLAFQLWSLAWSLSTRNWKSMHLLPLSLKCIPRYLVGFWTRLTWRVWVRLSWSSIGILGEQYKSNFARFIFWPEMEQYQSRISCKFLIVLLSFLKKRSESSAKKRWVKESPFLPTFTPWICLRFCAWDRKIERMFAQKMNR